MNLSETIELIRALKECGATHFKSADFEVDLLSRDQAAQPSMTGAGSPAAPIPTILPEIPPEMPPDMPENKEAVERVKALTETLKLKDEDLLDRLFPVGPELGSEG